MKKINSLNSFKNGDLDGEYGLWNLYDDYVIIIRDEVWQSGERLEKIKTEKRANEVREAILNRHKF